MRFGAESIWEKVTWMEENLSNKKKVLQGHDTRGDKIHREWPPANAEIVCAKCAADAVAADEANGAGTCANFTFSDDSSAR